jgi:hypothetical protein
MGKTFTVTFISELLVTIKEPVGSIASLRGCDLQIGVQCKKLESYIYVLPIRFWRPSRAIAADLMARAHVPDAQQPVGAASDSEAT